MYIYGSGQPYVYTPYIYGAGQPYLYIMHSRVSFHVMSVYVMCSKGEGVLEARAHFAYDYVSVKMKVDLKMCT